MNNINPYFILLNEYVMRDLIRSSGRSTAIALHSATFSKYLNYLRNFYHYIDMPISMNELKRLTNKYLSGKQVSTTYSPLNIGCLLTRGERLTGSQMQYIENIRRGVQKIIY